MLKLQSCCNIFNIIADVQVVQGGVILFIQQNFNTNSTIIKFFATIILMQEVINLNEVVMTSMWIMRLQHFAKNSEISDNYICHHIDRNFINKYNNSIGMPSDNARPYATSHWILEANFKENDLNFSFVWSSHF